MQNVGSDLCVAPAEAHSQNAGVMAKMDVIRHVPTWVFAWAKSTP